MKINTRKFKILSKINHSDPRSYVYEARFNTRDFKLSPHHCVSYDSQSKYQAFPYIAFTESSYSALCSANKFDSNASYSPKVHTHLYIDEDQDTVHKTHNSSL